MKVVLDTNVLLSATLWHGSVSQKLLAKLIRNNTRIYSSMEIIAEYENVLKRDFEYTNRKIAILVEKILLFSTLINPKRLVKIVKADPADDKIVNCAVEASAEYIITYDPHLLNLVNYRGTEIITPETAMKKL